MTQDILPASCTVLVSNALDGEIGAFKLDTTTGRIEPDCKYAAAEAVMPMTFSPDRSLMFAATRGAKPSVVTYRVDAPTGRLSRTGAANIASSLAYLCADPSGRYLLGASYGEHRLSIYDASRIAEGDGAALQVIGDIEHAHAVIVSADGRFAYVSSLGANQIFCFGIDAQSQAKPASLLEIFSLGDGFGPRHLRLSPDGTSVYVLSEFQATVAVLHRDSSTGRLAFASVSARPPAVDELQNGRARSTVGGSVQPDPTALQSLVWAADIQVTPDNRFVYVSERTTSRLICYGVQADGSLEYRGFSDTETQPRGFQIDPTGRFLVACGEKSSYLAVYSIDPESGTLTLLSRCKGGRGANWVEFISRSSEITPNKVRSF